ncbi:hypothetical protein BGX29_002183 [Mortierella sp. GBA35]|nr:hypothetical protein BGX29_002183 [Mortierella sp. GBA35]
MATSTIRVTFRGAMKCYLVYETRANDGCLSCINFIHHERTRFADHPHRTFGVIPLDESHKTVQFNICWFHQLRMKLIPWGDYGTMPIRTTDLDLAVCGWKRDYKWLDSVVVCGKVCKMSVEIYCPVVQAPVVYHQCYYRHGLESYTATSTPTWGYGGDGGGYGYGGGRGQTEKHQSWADKTDFYGSVFRLGIDIGLAFFLS